MNQHTFHHDERPGLLPRPQALGFPLAEVDSLVRLRALRHERHRVRAIAERKLTDIDVTITELRSMDRALAKRVASLSTPERPRARSTGVARG